MFLPTLDCRGREEDIWSLPLQSLLRCLLCLIPRFLLFSQQQKLSKMLESLFLVCGGAYVIYKLWTLNWTYWKRLSVPHVPPVFPLGSSTGLVLQTQFQGHAWKELYDGMAEQPLFGVYLLRSPLLVLRDPELIKVVMSQSFHNFRDRQLFRRSREPLTNHLFNLEGEPWRALRVKLTSTFTSGKLKGMFPLFLSCAKTLENLIENSEDGIIDVKDMTARFSTDIIGTCAFGLEMDSIVNPHSGFRKVGVEIFTPRRSTALKMAFVNTFPKLMKLFSPRFTSKSVERFILKAVKETIEYRMKTGLRRKDFIDLLMILKEETKGTDGDEMSLEMMAAQCFVFFTAGFETSSSVMSCCLFELAIHRDIQEKLHAEMDLVIQEEGGLTYEALHKMPYLDMVVSETMRKYPTLPTLNRVCTQTTLLPSGHKVERGTRIIIPVWALHHDPKYFPRPEVFLPERFAEDRAASIPPFAFLPFGEGPRMCIGKRFGLLQTKIGLVTFLRRWRVERRMECPVPLPLSPSSLLITATEGPIPLRFAKRTNVNT